MFVVWLCQQGCPEQQRRMVEHPKSHKTQVPSALTSTLELLKSLWATGGLCTSASKDNMICLDQEILTLHLLSQAATTSEALITTLPALQ